MALETTAQALRSDGAPIAELRPIARRRFASRDQIRAVFGAAPPGDFERFRRALERFRRDLDRLVD